jgi:hypothetical protein
MNDETKTYTVEEVRTAFMDGAAWVDDFRAHYAATPARNERVCETLRRYPKPKKLREVEDLGTPTRFRCLNGIIEGSNRGYSVWTQLRNNDTRQPWAVTPERIKLWADLLDNPYEDDK